ncbi:MAG: methyltransferase domain-containing protein [Actinomycetota bacterium]|nr:methyltransferase domain-containing protein [Actinomycetota bacterium]
MKWAFGIVNQPVAIRRLRRTIARTPQPFRIEVGGHRFTRPGWISTDKGWRTALFMDATSRWPFPSGSADLIYSDNVIEHIRMEGNRRLFREARRVLRSGGRIRLATPDVRRIAELYTGDPTEADWHIAQSQSKGYEAHHHVDLLRIVFQEAGHHVGYLWDFESLSLELREAGFADVARYESGLSDTPELVGLERRDERPASPVMLVIEAVRP